MQTVKIASQPTCLTSSVVPNDVFVVGLASGTILAYQTNQSPSAFLLWTYTKSKSPTRSVMIVPSQGANNWNVWCSYSDGSVRIFDGKSGKLIHRYANMHDGVCVNCMLFLDESNCLVATGDDLGCIKVWKEFTCIQQYNFNTDYITDLKFIPENRLLFAASGDGTLQVYHTRQSEVFAGTECLDQEYQCLEFANGNQLLYAFSNDNSIDIYKWDYWGEPASKVLDLEFSIESVLRLNELQLVVGCSDGMLRILRIPENKFVASMKIGEFPIERVCLCGGLILCISHSNEIYLIEPSELLQQQSSGKKQKAKETKNKTPSSGGDFFAELA